MATFHLLRLDQAPILYQLQLEEALLRTNHDNWCIINYGSPSAIVMGISAKMDEVIQKEKLKQVPVPVIRRFSGGGTVFVDENTCFISFICNTTHITIPPFPEHIMRWTEHVYQPLFSHLPFRLHENDYILDSRKFGGNAQSICKNRWLHHSSLLWDYCPNNMDYLLMPKKMPHYRQQRSHGEFLCRLKDYWSSKELFMTQFVNHLMNYFKVIEVKEEKARTFLDIPHRRSTIAIECD